MEEREVHEIIQEWPPESQEAARLVIERYGEPDEMTDSILLWQQQGPWKRMVAYKEFSHHEFPAPHIDAVESFLVYQVPPEKFDELAQFDGSVVANRTAGELSARCHDEQANYLAINLAHDIIIGDKTVEEARAYYAKEFLAARTGGPTPYMEGLRFIPEGEAGDPDKRIISERELTLAES